MWGPSRDHLGGRQKNIPCKAQVLHEALCLYKDRREGPSCWNAASEGEERVGREVRAAGRPGAVGGSGILPCPAEPPRAPRMAYITHAHTHPTRTSHLRAHTHTDVVQVHIVLIHMTRTYPTRTCTSRARPPLVHASTGRTYPQLAHAPVARVGVPRKLITVASRGRVNITNASKGQIRGGPSAFLRAKLERPETAREVSAFLLEAKSSLQIKFSWAAAG